MDGYEVCLKLKADPRTAAIPIIFISALDEPMDKVRAFECGAADYVSKPFQAEEVLARIEHQLRIDRLQNEMREANQKLVELDRIKGNLTAMLVHDLRAPLTVISLALGAIGTDDAEEVAELLDISKVSLRKMLALINDALDVYRTSDGAVQMQLARLEVAPVLARCGEVARVEARMKGLALDVRITEPLAPIVGDAVKLDRALSNLLSNAVKFTPSGGRVSLSAETAKTGSLVVKVADNGQGIPESELPFVFEPFRQADTEQRPHGFGLGLAIAKRVVESHHGTIVVDSTMGRGTIFTIELPSARSETLAAHAE
jgi:two-component system sensor histidine kinase/response regulator